MLRVGKEADDKKQSCVTKAYYTSYVLITQYNIFAAHPFMHLCAPLSPYALPHTLAYASYTFMPLHASFDKSSDLQTSLSSMPKVREATALYFYCFSYLGKRLSPHGASRELICWYVMQRDPMILSSPSRLESNAMVLFLPLVPRAGCSIIISWYIVVYYIVWYVPFRVFISCLFLAPSWWYGAA